MVRVLIVAMTIGLLGVACTGILAVLLDKDPDMFTREPQIALEGPWYVGSLSNMGAVFWCVATVASGLTATVLSGRLQRMFAAVGVLSAALLFDDLFLLHDAVYPKLGINETMVQAIYLLAIVVIVLRFRAEMGNLVIAGVVLTLGWWGVSVFLDTFFNDHAINLDQLSEDGAKFIGIVVWAGTWTALAHLTLRDRIAGVSPDPS